MWPSESETSEIQPHELASILADAGAAKGRNFALIDCREPDEFEVCRIEGAQLIPLSNFVFEAVQKLPEKSLPIVVYCHHGMRSAQATTFLRKKGYARTFSMAGGIETWSVEIDPEIPRY
jgi:rhodanese-related sulfurtransferase